MGETRRPHRQLLVKVQVRGASTAAEGGADDGSYVERKRRFWESAHSAPGSRLESDGSWDARESLITGNLAQQLRTRAQTENADITIEDVRIVDYGSMDLAIYWCGPDVVEVIFRWVEDCLIQILGPSLLITREADVKQEQLSIAARGAQLVLSGLPKSPLALFFVLLFVVGGVLLAESQRMSESLIDKRTVLIDKLVTNANGTGSAWQATFAALATPACARSADRACECCPPVPSAKPPPSRPSGGPSCCQQLAVAISSALTIHPPPADPQQGSSSVR